MEGMQLREAAEISLIGCDDGNSATGRAHGKQGVVG